MDDYSVVTQDHRASLGEGPMWSARDQAVYWVDILGRALLRFRLADGALRIWHLPDMVGWIVERAAQPGFIVGMAGGFAELLLDPLTFRPIGGPAENLATRRMNDAKVDPAGRIWAGTMDVAAAAQVGALYRLDADHTWREMDSGYTAPNGPAFSPDGRFLYHTDTLAGVIYRFVLEPDGSIRGKEPFVRFESTWGLPDGMATDVDGCLWVAHWDGGRVTRFTPGGRAERTVALPVSRPTSCAFGGDRLDRLFVTSAALDRPGEALAGALFEIDPGVRGVPLARFAG